MATPGIRVLRKKNLSRFISLQLVIFGLLCSTAGVNGEAAKKESRRSAKTTQPGILWSPPTDVTRLDLRYGAGGENHAPRGTVFQFEKEDLSGSNPKFIVTDQDGAKWKIKLGAEAKPEVAASRLVWAVGYFTNENYFLPELQVTGLPAKLHRGRRLVAADGTMHDARLQRMDKKESNAGNWRWKHDPFEGDREWNGLRAMMALINNWDLKDVNNKVAVERKPQVGNDEVPAIYYVSDLGASFGATGIGMKPSKSRGNLRAYRSSKFITKVTPQYVDFATPSRATFLEAFNPPKYWMRMRLRWIGKRVPKSDVKWIATILARLTPTQIRDAFRSAGYSPEEVEGFAQVVEGRISSLSDI